MSRFLSARIRNNAIPAALALALAALLCTACPQGGTGNQAAATDDSGTQVISATLVSDVVKARGMHCGACEMAIETSLAALPGVISVDADFKSTEVVVEYDAQQSSHGDVVAAIEKLGYAVEEVEPATGDTKSTVPSDADPETAAEGSDDASAGGA